jgi:hypothetical protein
VKFYKCEFELIDLEKHWVTNVIDGNFMIRHDILFSENENWHFMYNFRNDSAICKHFDYDLKTPYDIVNF